ncbi:hypothetical protein PUN28_017700 [Cardiocondyla obscurior]|uniref:Uncharacterized protein n=1 Tax=Cardiocondyla obscurior TaxID=286306 RepID=A0AAW2EIN5_9HYME
MRLSQTGSNFLSGYYKRSVYGPHRKVNVLYSFPGKYPGRRTEYGYISIFQPSNFRSLILSRSRFSSPIFLIFFFFFFLSPSLLFLSFSVRASFEVIDNVRRSTFRQRHLTVHPRRRPYILITARDPMYGRRRPTTFHPSFLPSFLLSVLPSIRGSNPELLGNPDVLKYFKSLYTLYYTALLFF